MDEKGEVVMVMEKRAVDAKREGYFIVQVSCRTQLSALVILAVWLNPQATPAKLLDQLLEVSIDESFHKDFLLTYRTFLKSPDPVLEKLVQSWESDVPETKQRVCGGGGGGVWWMWRGWRWRGWRRGVVDVEEGCGGCGGGGGGVWRGCGDVEKNWV